MAIRLVDPAGGALPAYDPGAHIDVRMPNGLVRPYSLVGLQRQADTYELGVAADAGSRGGSRWLVEAARPGDTVAVSAPRNNFALAEDAAHSVLIAGGIGITPLLGMAERLAALGRTFDLHVSARTRSNAPFLDRLSAYGPRVHTAFTRETGGQRLDLAAIVLTAPLNAHLYCCGPAGMIDAFATVSDGRPPAHIHVERFAAVQEKALEGGFVVELARSRRSITVPAGKSILDCILQAGLDVPSSCIMGVCGTCETRVMAGVPDHRDVILTPAERAANTTMMICCSGAKTPILTLDL